MDEFLEFSLDKFTFKVAKDRFYLPEGVWAKVDGNRVMIGVSDFWQQRQGDVVFAEAAEAGTVLAVGDEVANIETIKVSVSLPSPVSGLVVEVNPRLEMEAEVINQNPYGDGWLVVVEVTNWEADRAKLLEPPAYCAHMQIEAKENQ